MALTRGASIGVLVLAVGITGTVTSPHCEISDIVRPDRVVMKSHRNTQYNGSGMVYLVAYSATAAAALGLAYNGLRGNLTENP